MFSDISDCHIDASSELRQDICDELGLKFEEVCSSEKKQLIPFLKRNYISAVTTVTVTVTFKPHLSLARFLDLRLPRPTSLY